jgi:NAD(P)-dependent dehydrogenase (short-subunit alcohol dehydrogenase family)
MGTEEKRETMQEPRTAIVTGASKGIGRGIAHRLAEVGYDVAVNFAGDRDGAEQTAETIRSKGRRAAVIQGDVGYREQVDHLFDRTVSELGIPFLVVNNAGVQTWKPLLELEEEDWDRVIRTNLKGNFLCAQRAAREMAKQGKGRIITIGSGCNKVPFPKLVSYTASKGGIEMFTRVAAVELGPLGITVNCVAPGAIEIERTRLDDPNYAETFGSMAPVRRVGQVQDIAEAVAFLASDSADFITGQTLYVDGGMYTQAPWPYD